jgi:hypothetical protein
MLEDAGRIPQFVGLETSMCVIQQHASYRFHIFRIVNPYYNTQCATLKVYLQNWPTPECQLEDLPGYPTAQVAANAAENAITLVVTDFGVESGVESIHTFMAQLEDAQTYLAGTASAAGCATDSSKLPFSRIVVITSDTETAIEYGNTYTLADTGVEFVARDWAQGSSPSARWDMCTAQSAVDTPWMMLVTSSFMIKANFKLPIFGSDATAITPIMPYLDYDSEYCGRECRAQIEGEQFLHPTFNRHYSQEHAVLNTAERTAYCELLLASFADKEPTVNGYFASLHAVVTNSDAIEHEAQANNAFFSKKNVEGMYKIYDRLRLFVVDGFEGEQAVAEDRCELQTDTSLCPCVYPFVVDAVTYSEGCAIWGDDNDQPRCPTSVNSKNEVAANSDDFLYCASGRARRDVGEELTLDGRPRRLLVRRNGTRVRNSNVVKENFPATSTAAGEITDATDLDVVFAAISGSFAPMPAAFYFIHGSFKMDLAMADVEVQAIVRDDPAVAQTESSVSKLGQPTEDVVDDANDQPHRSNTNETAAKKMILAETAATDTDSGSGSTALIGAAAGVGALLLLLVVGGVIMNTRAKKEEQATVISTDSTPRKQEESTGIWDAVAPCMFKRRVEPVSLPPYSASHPLPSSELVV